MRAGDTILLPASKLSKRDKDILHGIHSGSTRLYPVRQGETIEAIIKARGVTLEEAQKLNPGANLKKLKGGEEINLPSTAFTVRRTCDAHEHNVGTNDALTTHTQLHSNKTKRNRFVRRSGYKALASFRRSTLARARVWRASGACLAWSASSLSSRTPSTRRRRDKKVFTNTVGAEGRTFWRHRKHQNRTQCNGKRGPKMKRNPKTPNSNPNNPNPNGPRRRQPPGPNAPTSSPCSRLLDFSFRLFLLSLACPRMAR